MNIGKGHPSLLITMVRLDSDRYSVPKGSIGTINGIVGESHYGVTWIGPLYDDKGEVVDSPIPTPGGGSVPVSGDDLEPLGLLNIMLSEGDE